MNKDILFFLIGVILTLTVLWGIFAFISFDLLWFIDSVVGRLWAIILIIVTFLGNFKAIFED